MVNVYTRVSRMAGHPKPDHLRRGKMLPIRLTAAEWDQLKGAASRLGMNVSEILREGAKLYIRETKTGHRNERRKSDDSSDISARLCIRSDPHA